MELGAILAQEYDRVRTATGVDFPKPSLTFDAQRFTEFAPGVILTGMHRGIFTYAGAHNEILAPEMPQNQELLPYYLCHELCHAMIQAVNHEMGHVTDMMLNNPLLQEKAIVYQSCNEGIADYVSINVHKDSPVGTELHVREEKLLRFYSSILRVRGGQDPGIFLLDWLNEDSWRGVAMGHELRMQLGYCFVHELQPKNILDVIKNPPSTWKEIIYPDEYKKRVSF